MNANQKWIYASLVVVLLVGSAAYMGGILGGGVIKSPNGSVEPPAETVNTISIGTVSEDAVKQINRFQPTADYIAAKLSDNKTKYEGKVIVVKTVDDVTELLKEQKLDLYVESPFATAIVATKSGSVPFLRRWKDGVEQYHSVIFVKRNSSINTLGDFVGKTIVFEDPGSTSAYMLPKAYLMQRGFNVSQLPGKNNISYIFSGAEENLPLWVIKGKADIGATANTQFEDAPAAVKDQLKVIDRTIDVPRHIVSHRSGLDPVLVERIKQILMDMDKDPQGAQIMKNFQNTKKYDEIPNKDGLFINISDIIKILD